MIRFRCISCGYFTSRYVSHCPRCRSLIVIDDENIVWKIERDEGSIWRYKRLLPYTQSIISLGEGYTPLKRVDSVIIKDETRNPTRTFIDRGASVYVSYLHPRENVVMPYIEDYTISISRYLSSLNIGVKVIVESGHIDPIEALYLADMGVDIEFADVKSAKEISTFAYDDPLMIEGYKTISYEIYEQGWKYLPDGIVVPSEKGILAFSIAKGLLELDRLLDLDYIPDIIITLTKDMPVPELVRSLTRIRIRVEYVDSTDALKTMTKLAKRGLYVKPLSAMAYSAAENLHGKYIAIISGSSLRRFSSRIDSLTDLQREIFNLMKRVDGLTAYQIWEHLGRRYTLQGVYQALNKLVNSGYLHKSIKMVGKKKIGIYFYRT
jgi:threonine synthase